MEEAGAGAEDPAVEAAVRRLAASVEAERERLRAAGRRGAEEAARLAAELGQLRARAEESCRAERAKIEEEWARLWALQQQMTVPRASAGAGVLRISCCGREFSMPRAFLGSVEGSYLNHMFSDAFIHSIPRDSEGRLFLDFNPDCFAFIVDWLSRRQGRSDAPFPPVPPEQQLGVDTLLEALHLMPFVGANRVSPTHGTSLAVLGSDVRATLDGWQVVAAERPLGPLGASRFEVHVAANTDSEQGGLAVGVCGRVPVGAETCSLHLQHAVLYVSGNGPVGSALAGHNVQKGIRLAEGDVLGVKYDFGTRTVQWYYNRAFVGTSSIKAESQEHMLALYPVLALRCRGQHVRAEFGGVPAKGPPQDDRGRP
ncbi:unnamed protein product [Prorocentrum cordatum]|uniref:B30.2/SPRY domain-containing protein n=1 Tax=Prorocentrum cordatum TaxID=2364126 RepID=A0ABN9TMA9_9DINO|nr:unnamed protein product [Polarella glacialis]